MIVSLNAKNIKKFNIIQIKSKFINKHLLLFDILKYKHMELTFKNNFIRFSNNF